MKLYFTILLLLPPFILFSQQSKEEKRHYTTAPRGDKNITIDGVFDDDAWDEVEWAADFTQRQPIDGAPPSQKTAFKVIYDDKYLYFAIRAFDTAPDSIVKRMSRRDGFEGDFVEVNIDSYHDLTNAFSFTVSVSGVIGDEAISLDGNNWDQSWDPIWWAKTTIDKEGWNAEMQIPLSQLRFTNNNHLTWGLQVTRRLFRNNERSYWQYIPRDAPGWVHNFGELTGLVGIKPQKQLEIAPYVLARNDRGPKEEGNPYKTGSEYGISAGVDGKIGITSDITFDFTVNPDFGQVEADPSQLNLSTFEIFLQERRPFFIEGRNTLSFAATRSRAGGSFSRDNLIYTRRIGKSPSYYPDTEEGQYLDQPKSVPILGAYKLTGKNKKGFAFGVMQNFTAKTSAEIDTNGEKSKKTVEPFTSYLVGRATQDINQGNSVVGVAFTSTNRNIQDDHLDYLHTNAYSGGIDFLHQWKDRTYYVQGNLMMSHVEGSTEAITNTQRSARHFFQRPDADWVNVDSTATSLTGTGGYLKFGRGGGSPVRYEVGGTWRSPKFEINDVGFMNHADLMDQWSRVSYQTLQPVGVFRNIEASLRQYLYFDYGGNITYLGFHGGIELQFQNFWRIETGGSIQRQRLDNFKLRGGPGFLNPNREVLWWNIGSDNRKKLSFYFGNEYGFTQFDAGQNFDAWFGMNYRPINAIELSINPWFSYNSDHLQYVTTEENGSGNNYILSRIEQHTTGVTIRANLILRPNLSIQYYAQPFASRGDYYDFKRVEQPKAKNYGDRFHQFTPDEISYNQNSEEYTVIDPQGGNYTFGKPDFDVVEFNSNLVLRWEYIPGCTFFAVWSQGRNGLQEPFREFSLNEIVDNVFSAPSNDVFMLKATYRFRK
ncbi:carbohydrate binding family 9 domain-containing protein [Flammeovirga yaeyamensis]|uniref:Carbohydrate binding family 9 domain-containing protein n=1 Tax=Flammeovirga yaeyamensis TaxID=367791 RepID=A0AAX1N8M3_9BACT|nr:DUF5916 domain-containing protein [Flammeovirga yaeyamensis]MBB3699605.1 hypothetical protein [Flammeovirga yaeyamensis]NMF36822.1 carbohydrate binding family 9 domain-containing protein [Flammeovirga yaeyamensis]QWG02138.1 carbohydrate binding family 9 domain-containing protein [Flammeovirga yaeyamensis]